MDPKKYAKVLADLDAGRNLPQAVRIFYQTENEDEIKGLVAMYTAQAREKRRKGERLAHPALGALRHDGIDFVGKQKSCLYPQGPAEVRLDPQLSRAAAVAEVWKTFRAREEELQGELEKAIAGHYEQFRCGTPFAKLKRLKRDSAIWKTLGRPTIRIERRENGPEICLTWSPEWEPEHGVHVYLTPKATVQALE